MEKVLNFRSKRFGVLRYGKAKIQLKANTYLITLEDKEKNKHGKVNGGVAIYKVKFKKNGNMEVSLISRIWNNENITWKYKNSHMGISTLEVQELCNLIVKFNGELYNEIEFTK